MLKTEITEVFWIRGHDGQEYKVRQFTEYSLLHMLGGEHWLPEKQYYVTDGGDAVHDLGEGHFAIPALNAEATWLAAKRAEAASATLPRPFMGFRVRQREHGA